MIKNTVYIDRANSSLKYERENIRIEVDGKLFKRIPLTLIDNLIIYGNAEIHSSIIHHCAAHDISMVFCKANSEELQMLLPKNHNDVTIKLKQYAIYQNMDARLMVAKSIVQNKITQQIAFLRKLGSSEIIINNIQQSIDNLPLATALSEILGYEGIAARQYFQEYTKLFHKKWNFTERNKHPALDPVNVVLSYFYTIVTKQCSLITYAKGFDPKIGYLHEVHFGRDSLACDMVEGVRCVIDELVYRLFNEDYFTLDDFSQEEGKCLLTKSGRAKIFIQVMSLKQDTRKHVNNNLALLGLV